MRNRRIEHGSFRARMDELVPLIGVEYSPVGPHSEEVPRVVVGPRGSDAYVINQFLYERSRH